MAAADSDSRSRLVDSTHSRVTTTHSAGSGEGRV
jgi:hypothetical protein